jgi:hypothetical protein
MGNNLGYLGKRLTFLLERRESGRRNPNNPHIEVMLQYYRKYLGSNKFKYDHTDSKWIDVDCIIYTVTMSYK